VSDASSGRQSAPRHRTGAAHPRAGCGAASTCACEALATLMLRPSAGAAMPAGLPGAPAHWRAHWRAHCGAM